MPVPEELLVREDFTIRQVIAAIDKGTKGIVLLVDEHAQLMATITDGDVRRAILAGTSLERPISELVHSRDHGNSQPLTAKVDTFLHEQKEIMERAGIRHLPILDEQRRVVGLTTMEDFHANVEELAVEAVIMAGGIGKRLRPFTDHMPKPMLPIGGRPLMERTIERLRESGISRINITTHYLPEKITGYFGDGRRFGVDLRYVSEDKPLGTAGSLGLVSADERTLLVMNGDILTRVDFKQLLGFHREFGAELTLGVRQYDVNVPYGVVESTEGIVHRLREKPKIGLLVNAGIYLVEPSARRLIPPRTRFDMTQLIERLLEQGRTVASFPVIEYWLDIGKHEDFRRAESDINQTRSAA